MMLTCDLCLTVLFLGILLPFCYGSCTFKSPSWSKGAPKVNLVSSSHPNKVLVDWSALIVNQGCVDQYSIWVWRDGQQKGQGRKFLVSDKNTLTKMVDIEPCLYHNFLVELKPGKATETVRFNSASLPALDRTSVLKHLSVGYHKDSRTGQFDLTKASIRLESSFLTFLQCIKHIEVSGVQVSGAKAVQAAASVSTRPTASSTSTDSWEPYGTGRQVGGHGRPERIWGYQKKRQAYLRSLSKVSKTGSQTLATTTARPASRTTRWGYSGSSTTPATPTAKSAEGWGYSIAPKPQNNISTKPNQWGHSPFTKQFLRMKETPSRKVAGPVKSTPPFKTGEIEIVVPVEPCKEYQFEMKIVSPNNAEVGKVSDIFLLSLADIPDYIPPPLTSVIEIKFLGGGKQTVGAKTNSPVPEECIIDYLEAVDTFANRVEYVANELASATNSVKKVQDNVQDNVERTQSESLSKLGCLCSSPRLEVSQGEAADFGPEFVGVYLYQGLHQSKPYFKLDLEDRSVAGSNPAPAQTPVLGRRKRFIGRVDGGGTTTTRRPVNFGVPQGSYTGGSFSTKFPSWREYFDISTQSPNTKYSNRYSGSSSSISSSSSSSSSSIRTSQTGSNKPTVGCPDMYTNLQLRQNADLLTKVSSWQECARKCAEKGSCQNWVWNHERSGIYALNCALMDGFGQKISDPNSVAGRWDCNYKGASGSGSNTPTSTGHRSSTSGSDSRRSSVSQPSRSSSVSQPSQSSSVELPIPEMKPRYLYWDAKSNKWLISDEVGSSSSSAEVSSAATNTKCPADKSGEVWQAKAGGRAISVTCSPGL